MIETRVNLRANFCIIIDIIFNHEDVTTDGYQYQRAIKEALRKVNTEQKDAVYTIEVNFYFEDCVIDVEEVFKDISSDNMYTSFWIMLYDLRKSIQLPKGICLQGIEINYNIDSSVCKKLELTSISELNIRDSEVLYLRAYDVRRTNIKNSKVFCETLLPLDSNNQPSAELNRRPCYYGFKLTNDWAISQLLAPTKEYKAKGISCIPIEKIDDIKLYKTQVKANFGSLHETVIMCENSSIMIHSTLFGCYVAYDINDITYLSDINHLIDDDSILSYMLDNYAIKEKFKDNYIAGNKATYNEEDIVGLSYLYNLLDKFSSNSDFDGDVMAITTFNT